jgi:hypothetical protein
VSDFPLGCCWRQHMMSKDCCNIHTVPTDWCFQIVQAVAASLQQRLVQYYSVEYWLMLSDSPPSCCIFAAKIGAMLLCWVLADAFRFSKLLHLCSKDWCKCYYVAYWLMILSDFASCCMVAAKMVQYASVHYWLMLLDSLSCNFATRIHAMLCWVFVVA